MSFRDKWLSVTYQYRHFIVLFAFLILSDLGTKSLMLSFYSQFEDPTSTEAIFIKLNQVPLVLASLGFESFHWSYVLVLAGLTIYMMREFFECLANTWFFWGELLASVGLFSNFLSFLIWGGVPDFIPIQLDNKLFYLNMADIYIVSAMFVFFALEPGKDLVKKMIHQKEECRDNL